MTRSNQGGGGGRLRRDLGTYESYAALIGILVGAGIFSVTSVASAATGSSVILGYLVFAPAVLATSVAYAVFLSTSLGLRSGAEFNHIAAVFGGRRTAFLCVWLKLVSYLGAIAFLSVSLADYLLGFAALVGLELEPATWRMPLAYGSLGFFYLVNACGARWFGRLQIGMCVALGVSVLVLVVPGFFAIETKNYAPWFPNGASGFGRSLPPLFFAFAGFEALAHTAGEVEESRRRLPRVFLKGILASTLIFVSMTVVAFGVLPAAVLETKSAPMADVAATYLPRGGAAFVAIGGILAVATSLNGTLFVPARLGFDLAAQRVLPRPFGFVHKGTGAPLVGLTATTFLSGLLLVTGSFVMALNVAVLALVLLYCLHSLALLLLPKRAPELYGEVSVGVSRRMQVLAALVSIGAMGSLALLQIYSDVTTILEGSWWERIRAWNWTSFELLIFWGFLGLATLALMSRARSADES